MTGVPFCVVYIVWLSELIISTGPYYSLSGICTGLCLCFHH